MNKPTTILIQELNSGIVESLNNSPLHPYVKLTILKQIKAEMEKVLDNVSIQEKELYLAELEKEKGELDNGKSD